MVNQSYYMASMIALHAWYINLGVHCTWVIWIMAVVIVVCWSITSM